MTTEQVKHRFQYETARPAAEVQPGNLIESLDSGLRYVVTKHQPEPVLVRCVSLADGCTCWVPITTTVRPILLKGA